MKIYEKRKRVLLAGTSFSAVPILSALRQYGHEIGVAGGMPDDPCHALADYSCFFDYSDRQQLLQAVKEHDVDYLCPSCNDYSYLACAWVAEQCNFPGYDSYETTEILHLKDRFRSFCEQNALPIPKAVCAHSGVNVKEIPFSFPMLIKPVDSFSGRGMTKVYSCEELKRSIDNAVSHSRKKEALVEEFVDGTLHSHSAFIRDGQFIFDVVVDEYCTVYPYQVNCSNLPSRLPQAVQNSVRECMQEMASRLCLNDGLLHTQFMVDGPDFWLIECMRRGPGDLYYQMVKMATGINGMDLYARPFIKERLPDPVSDIRIIPHARHTISVSRPLVFSSFSVDVPAEKVQMVPLKQSGAVLKEAPFDKLGIFFAEFEGEGDLHRYTPRLADCVTIQSVL